MFQINPLEVSDVILHVQVMVWEFIGHGISFSIVKSSTGRSSFVAEITRVKVLKRQMICHDVHDQSVGTVVVHLDLMEVCMVKAVGLGRTERAHIRPATYTALVEFFIPTSQELRVEGMSNVWGPTILGISLCNWDVPRVERPVVGLLEGTIVELYHSSFIRGKGDVDVVVAIILVFLFTGVDPEVMCRNFAEVECFAR